MLIFTKFHGLDKNRFKRNITMPALMPCLHQPDGINNFHPIAYLAEYRIAILIHVLAGMVQGGLIINVYEKLRSGAVNYCRACHGEATLDIFQTVVRLVLS